MITQEYIKQLFSYSDGNLYWKVAKGSRAKVGDKAGTLNNTGYIRIIINGKAYQAHRIIFLIHHNYLPEFIDHIDGNKVNNCVENLREATLLQNNCNQKLLKANTSGYKNVSWHKQLKKWQVTIKVNTKQRHMGIFDDLELAELVAIEARDKYHKEFARHK